MAEWNGNWQLATGTAVRYDLYRGHPNAKLLPQSEMRSIMSAFLEEDKDEKEMEGDSWGRYLNYGPNAGDDRFRSVLRSFLDRRTETDYMGEGQSNALEKQGRVDHELFITNGVSHGLELLCATQTSPGDEVWVERPTYFLAPKIFESNGLIVKSLPMISDRDGGKGDIGQIHIDRLVRMVEVDGVPPPRMMYVIPSYHNPTGRSMAYEERLKLASFAIKHGVILLADEVYHLLDWSVTDEPKVGNDTDYEKSHQRPAGIVHFNKICSESDRASSETMQEKQGGTKEDKRIGCCISVSSFTKIWAPGIRLGWIDAPSPIIQSLERYGYINSQGGVAPLMGRIMTHAIENGLLDGYVDKLQAEYAERYEMVCRLLKDEPRISILTQNTPVMRRGGYFIWVQFPASVDGDDFLSYSLEHFGVRFMSGSRCDPFHLEERDVCGASIRSCARLCFADLDRDELENGTSAFLEAFQSYMKSIE